MLEHRRLSLNAAQLWPLAVIILLGCLIALVPIDQVDFWWHLALGRTISQQGAVPTVDTYSWTLPPQTPFTYGSWLAEWLFFQLYRLGDLPLIVLVRNLIGLASYSLVGAEAWRRSRSWRLAALAIAGAGLMTLNNVSVRPQIFAWLPFAAFPFVLGLYRARQVERSGLLILPVLMLVWANVHGSFVLGLGLVGATLAGETITTLLRRQEHMSCQRLRWLWLVALATGAAIVLNPRGMHIVQFVAELVSNPGVRELVGEWQPPDLLAFPGVLLIAALVLIALGWWRHPQRFNLPDAITLAAFAWLAIGSTRNLLWFGMIAWPIAAGALAGSPKRMQRRTPSHPMINSTIAAGLCIPLLVVQPPLKARLDLAPALDGVGNIVPHGDLIGSSTPVRAVAWLQHHPLPADAHLFNEMTYGSYLMWALPNLRIAADTRIELYPYEFWQHYRQISRGENALAQLDSIGATHALLSQQATPKLIQQLNDAHSGWQQLYADEQAIIFARRTEEQP